MTSLIFHEQPVAVMTELIPHPLAQLFPRPSKEEYSQLKESIGKVGLLEEIVTTDEPDPRIIDGITRYTACKELGVPIKTKTIKGDEAYLRDYVYNKNVHRRRLTDDQKIAISALFYPNLAKESEKAKEATELSGKTADGIPVTKSGTSVDIDCSPPKRDIQAKHARSTAGKLATAAGVSERKAVQAITLFKADPALLEEVASGNKSLGSAVKAVAPKVPKPRRSTLERREQEKRIKTKPFKDLYSKIQTGEMTLDDALAAMVNRERIESQGATKNLEKNRKYYFQELFHFDSTQTPADIAKQFLSRSCIKSWPSDEIKQRLQRFNAVVTAILQLLP
jgi:hypothetical protein